MINNEELKQYRNEQIKEFADNLFFQTINSLGEKKINFNKYDTEVAKAEITNPIVGKAINPEFFGKVYAYIKSMHTKYISERTDYLTKGYKTDSTYQKIDKSIAAYHTILSTMEDVAKIYDIKLPNAVTTTPNTSATTATPIPPVTPNNDGYEMGDD